MNIIRKNSDNYKFESMWRYNFNPLGTPKDDNNRYFPWPVKKIIMMRNMIYLIN